MRKLLSIAVFLAFFLVPIASTRAAVSVKILIVPGHDNTVWGAEYGNTKEADMNLAVATKIYDLLKQDNRFEVFITRDKSGYTKNFADFQTQKDSIISFEQNAKKLLQVKVVDGTFVSKNNTPHHSVAADVALRLYGFNKWANENKIDAMIHVHFNDYPRPSKWTIGQYQGFTIYLPESQFTNAKASKQLALDIFNQLRKKYAVSNWKPESAGITPDQKLIAIGSNGTLNSSVRSVLIEYGYIYEKKFRSKDTRQQAYANMADLTVAGIKNYFFK